MKKALLVSVVLLVSASCSSINKFSDDVFGKEPYQPIPSSKRAPLLNNKAQVTYPERAMPSMGYGNVPQAPEPWGNVPMAQPYGSQQFAVAAPQLDIMRTPVPQLPQLDVAGLPSNRRAPAMNTQGRVVPMSAPAFAPQIRPVQPQMAIPQPPQPPQFAPMRGTPPAWEPNEYPRLAQVPPAAQPPIPLRQDPRVQELQRELNPDFVPPQTPRMPEMPPMPQFEDAIAVPVKPVARAPLPEFVDENEPVKPVTNFTKLRPIAPQYTPEPLAPVRPSVASTDYRQLRPIPEQEVISAHNYSGVRMVKSDALPPSRYANRTKIYRYRGPAR